MAVEKTKKKKSMTTSVGESCLTAISSSAMRTPTKDPAKSKTISSSTIKPCRRTSDQAMAPLRNHLPRGQDKLKAFGY